MKKIILLLLSVLPVIGLAQVVKVNVSALSEEGSNERVGVVLQKDAETDTFYNLAVELKAHSDKVLATKAVDSRKKSKSEAEILDESIAKMEEMKKKGLLSEAEFQRMKSTMTAQLSKNAAYGKVLEQDAAGPGSANPSALKEKIRSYCIGKRFYWDAKIRNNMVGISDKKADGKIYIGIIDATTGSMLIEPDRFDAISYDKEHGYFTKEGYAIAGLEGKSVLINKSGRIVLNGGYDNLSFYNDCRILKARKGSKVGIIDYQGNVLEPFIHGSFKSEDLQKDANRIFKEKGGVKVEIW